jgi:hypothetical protein
MKAANHHPNSVAVQIVQIGNDDGAMEALKDLMHGDVGVRITLFFILRSLKVVGRAWSILPLTMGY